MENKKYEDEEIKPCGHQGFETMPDGSCAVAACGKHTPGPWNTQAKLDGTYGVGMGQVSYASNIKKFEDARLIACAPELLEAVKGLLDYVPADGGSDNRTLRADIKALIAKAGGGA